MRWLALLALVACHPHVTLPAGEDLVIDTGAGKVRGRQLSGASVFLGIPYATAGRWELPHPHATWEGVRDATHAGPVCPQGEGSVRGDEDCLQLNVFAPAPTDHPAAVMVFVHGGAFLRGSSTTWYLDATRFARVSGLVVVTIDYRVGVLGMLAHPAIGRGNYGIADAIEALRWVHAHAAAFGGDPANVTLVGESSGAITACAILGAPSADGLYARAMLESGGGCAQFPTPETAGDAPSGFSVGAAIATGLGCADAACLRGKSTAEMVRAQAFAPKSSLGFPSLGVLVDGAIVTEMPAARVRHRAVPLVIGSNADEGTLLAPKGTDRARFTREVFTCPAARLAAAATEGGARVYLYELRQRAPTVIGDRLGAFHGLELFYLFESFPGADHLPDADRRVATTIQDAWASFAKVGVPRAAKWPVYPALLAIADPPVVTATDCR